MSLAALPVLIELIGAAGTLADKMRQANAENREVTPEEWAEVDAQRKAAWDRLDAAIAEAESNAP